MGPDPHRLVRNEVAQNLLRTSGFLALLRQSDLDKQQLTQILQLSPQQQSDIERSIGDGEGLLIAGNATVGFTDNFPKGDLYNLWNTKPDELADAKREAWERKLGRRAARKASAQAVAESETMPAEGLRATCEDAAGADNGEGSAKAEEKGAAPVASEGRPTPAAGGGLDAKEARERAKKLAVPDAVRALITHALTCGTCSGTASELAAMCGAKASGMALARLLNVHEQAISEAGLSLSVDRSSKPHTITLARTR